MGFVKPGRYPRAGEAGVWVCLGILLGFLRTILGVTRRQGAWGPLGDMMGDMMGDSHILGAEDREG